MSGGIGIALLDGLSQGEKNVFRLIIAGGRVPAVRSAAIRGFEG
jgi:hypothetical protein